MWLKRPRHWGCDSKEGGSARCVGRIESFWEKDCVEENCGTPDGSLEDGDEFDIHGNGDGTDVWDAISWDLVRLEEPPWKICGFERWVEMHASSSVIRVNLSGLSKWLALSCCATQQPDNWSSDFPRSRIPTGYGAHAPICCVCSACKSRPVGLLRRGHTSMVSSK
jgi:hypothetical protein